MTHRILHLLGTGELEGASISRTVASLASCIDSARYRMHAWFLGSDGPLVSALQNSGVQTRVLHWQSGARDPRGAWQFWREMQRVDFAIVHQHFGGRSVRWIVRQASRAKMIVHVHGRVCEARGAEPVTIRIGNADAVIAVSDAVARQVTGVRASVVYPGIKVATQSSDPVVVPTLNPESLIGTACRLVPIKGLQYLLQALVRLRERFPEIRLEIAGAGVLRSDLEGQVDALGLSRLVTFLGWQSDMAAVMPRWNIYVQPSVEEGFGIAALEAMAAGLPVIATDVGGTSELVQDGETGWLVAPRDPAGLAGKIGALLDDGELRGRMGQAGRIRARDFFSDQRMAAETAAIYARLLGDPGPAK